MHFHCDKGLLFGGEKIVVAIDTPITFRQMDLPIKKDFAINSAAAVITNDNGRGYGFDSDFCLFGFTIPPV